MEREIVYRKEKTLNVKEADNILDREGFIILKEGDVIVGVIIKYNDVYIIDLSNDQYSSTNLEKVIDYGSPYTPYLITAD